MQTPLCPDRSNVPDRATRLVYLPTNRPFEAALRSVVAEVDAVRAHSHDHIRLLVIDDCSAEVSRSNSELTERVGREHACNVQVLTQRGWRGLVEEIVDVAALATQDREAAQSALLKPSGSYGAGPNKAAVIAAFVGAASLHRRDSDQITQVDHRSGYSPLDIEIGLLEGAPAPVSEGMRGIGAYCVGSSLTGQSTRDRRDIQHVSLEIPRRIDDLSGLTQMAARKPRAGAQEVSERGVFGGHVHVERDRTGAVEMGIAALRTVYEWIPEMPGVGILGSDYFQKGLLYQLELPVYYHELRAHHVYEDWRAEQIDEQHLGWYAVAELRYSVLRYHWNEFNQSLKASRQRLIHTNDGFNSAAYGELFVDAQERGAHRAAGIAHEFVATYKEAAAAASGDVRRRMEIRVAALEEVVDSTAHYVAAAIHEFAGLARMWPALMSASARIGRQHGHKLHI